ncbi:MAG TPA: 4Fe-4S dicluster domain-containing protein [Terriglobales bacterium]|nr:4Fe-4S dicluster domain-containing protein [Terriglobales bacterium]
MSKAILYDATLCIDCKQCEQACAAENGLPYDDKIAAEEFTSAHKYTAVLSRGDKYMRRMCMNCNDPACASVCPVGAMKKTALGPVIYDKNKCMGCRYCMAACPFGVPKYEWNKRVPGVRKCIMCNQRVEAGKPTACAEACPTGATKFGDRDELLEEARRRIHDKPDVYLHHIFGEEEVGGTSVLLISSVPATEFRYPANLTQRALPMYTYQVLSRIPDFIPLFGTLLGGIFWITHRREDVAEAEKKGGER